MKFSTPRLFKTENYSEVSNTKRSLLKESVVDGPAIRWRAQARRVCCCISVMDAKRFTSVRVAETVCVASATEKREGFAKVIANVKEN